MKAVDQKDPRMDLGDITKLRKEYEMVQRMFEFHERDYEAQGNDIEQFYDGRGPYAWSKIHWCKDPKESESQLERGAAQ